MYDPLLQNYPEPAQLPNSFWANEVTEEQQDPILNHHRKVDIAIIGAGYTGLSSAYHLATQFQRDVVVLEACQVGWGCSGRNAGFVLASSGRLSQNQLIQRFGDSQTSAINREFEQSVTLVNQLIEQGQIECNVVKGGYAKLAHNQKYAQQLVKHAENSKGDLYCLDKTQLKERLIHADYAQGALYDPRAFGLHPLKYCQGLAALCRAQSVSIYGQSPVIEWQQITGNHVLSTPQGSIIAKQVILASNAYTGFDMHSIVNNRQFPVLSSVLVTEKLSVNQQQALSMKSGLLVMDTRPMKYYYRLLPCGRLLFGGRGAIYGKDADNSKYQKWLLQGLEKTLPQLEGIQAEYFWSGWVDIAFDGLPRIWYDDKERVGYGMGYCGSGVAFATQAGKRLAEQICAPDRLPNLPFWKSPLSLFPLPKLRRPVLWVMYQLDKLAAKFRGI